MEKELTINGKLYRLVEEKPLLEVGKWYIINGIPNSTHLYLGDSTGVGFARDKSWTDFVGMTSPTLYVEADMDEVKKLLIGKAEKYRGADIKCIRGQIGTKGTIDTDTEFILKHDELSAQNMNCSYTLFDFKTGEWADIIEEKKPSLYIIKITETTKSFPKSTYYKCEIGGTLQDVVNKKDAFVFECIEAAENIAEFINATYDFKSTIIDL